MTGVLAVSFPYKILVIADCRVSWQHIRPRLQDNLQKLYHFSPTGVIGFAGGVPAAKALFRHIRAQPKGQPLPPSPKDIVTQLSSWAKQTYHSLAESDKVEFELLYAAADYSRVSLAAENLVFAENILTTMAAPEFKPQFHTDTATLGYAKSLPTSELIRARDDLLSVAVEPHGIEFQVAMIIGSFGEKLARISGHPVGALFTAASVDARGVTWHPYSHSREVGLLIKGRSFVQFDNRQEPPRAFPLEGVWEFDTRHPSPVDLYVGPPH
jgi:hypothetical protein